MHLTDKVILGIDPGTQILGFGVIHIKGKSVSYTDMGVVNLKCEKDHFLTLRRILNEVTKLIDTYLPDELAIESPFYGKNPQVMLKLGRAQGAAISAALMRDIPVYEYAPRSVKVAITGNGSASKEQVATMVQKLLGITDPQKYADATDALSIALCHHYHRSSLGDTKVKRETSWESFVKNNPQRIEKKKL